MDIQEKEALIAEIERFKEEAMKSYVVSRWAESYTNTDPFGYVILKNENNKVWWMKTQAHQLWEMWKAAQAVPEGFVLIQKDHLESMNEFKDLYKRAIINARKRKDQLNWAHVAGLGVGSGRAVELCKMLYINPGATNMHEVIEAKEPAND